MASAWFLCPRCRRRLEKSAQAFVMGRVGLKPAKDDPASVTCPACGFAIPTAAMLAGDLDPKFDWATPAAAVAGGLGFLYFRWGQDLALIPSLGTGLVVAFTLLGACDLLHRLRR